MSMIKRLGYKSLQSPPFHLLRNITSPSLACAHAHAPCNFALFAFTTFTDFAITKYQSITYAYLLNIFSEYPGWATEKRQKIDEKGSLNKRERHLSFGERKTEMLEFLREMSEMCGKTSEKSGKKSDILDDISLISKQKREEQMGLVWRLWKQKVQNPCSACAYAGAKVSFLRCTKACNELRWKYCSRGAQNIGQRKGKGKLTLIQNSIFTLHSDMYK